MVAKRRIKENEAPRSGWLGLAGCGTNRSIAELASTAP
jgi:hypothetical protein